MSDGKTETLMLHQWIYVIIPWGSSLDIRPLFSAYCKNCQNYFVEDIPTDEIVEKTYQMSKSNLPKWGCTEPPMPI